MNSKCLTISVILIIFFRIDIINSQKYYLNKSYLVEKPISWINAQLINTKNNYLLLYERTIPNWQSSLSVSAIDDQGNILDSLWIRVDSAFLFGQYLDKREDGRLIIIGTYTDNRDPEPICPMWIEVDIERKEYQIRTYCDEHKRSIRNITKLSNGNYAASGFTNINGKSQIMLIVFDEYGNILAEREYGSGPWHEAFGSIVEHPEGGLVIGGWIMQEHPFLINFDMLVLRIDQNYNLLWSKQIGGEDDDGEGTPLNIDPDGHIIITSMRSRLEDNRLKIDPYFARLHKQDGRILTERTYPLERNSSFFGQPYIFENGDVVVAGYRRVFIEHINFSTMHTSITKMNSSGDILWDRVIVYVHDGSNLTGLGKPIYYEDGFYWVYGSTYPFNDRIYAWLIKLDSLGCPYPGCDTLTVSVETLLPLEEQGHMVAYPNPFGDQLTLSYAFPNPVHNPMVYIQDMMGSTILAVPLNGQAPQGDVFIDCSRWSPGLYSMQIRSEGRVICQTKGVKK
jgi:hypothetical protein